VTSLRGLLDSFVRENEELLQDNETLLASLEDEKRKTDSFNSSSALIEKEQLKIMQSLDRIVQEMRGRKGK
jgi:hypothetical protein